MWMNACTAFIFAALIEFTFVNYWYRKQTCRVGGGGGGGGGGGFGFNPVYGGREADGIELVSARVVLEGLVRVAGYVPREGRLRDALMPNWSTQPPQFSGTALMNVPLSRRAVVVLRPSGRGRGRRRGKRFLTLGSLHSIFHVSLRAKCSCRRPRGSFFKRKRSSCVVLSEGLALD